MPRPRRDSPAPGPHGTLCSDHLNYLVWRYLQERGFNRTAIQLMREWNMHPQELPFARFVNVMDLVSVVQDGLWYDQLESHVRDQDRRYVFFDEEKVKAARASDEANRAAGEADKTNRLARLENAGRSKDDAQHSAERDGTATSRLQENGQMMDVERPPSSSKVESNEPPVEEPLPLASTLSIGESTGMQSEPPFGPFKVPTFVSIVLPEAEVLNLNWTDLSRYMLLSPRELSASGVSVWKTWTFNNPDPDPDLEPVITDSDEEILKTTNHGPEEGGFNVSASSRAPSGEYTAAAFEDTVILLSPNGDRRVLAKGVGTVINLRWSPTSTFLLLAMQQDASNELAVVDLRTDMYLNFATTPMPIEDAVWATDSSLVVCGVHFIDLYNVGESIEKVGSIGADSFWAFIRYDQQSRRAACVAPDEGKIAVLDIDKFQFETIVTQDDQITDVQWWPSRKDDPDWPYNDPHLLATSSTDGNVTIWRWLPALKTLRRERTFVMASSSPAMTLAFSPNQQYIAAAGDEQVYIWMAHTEEKRVGVWRPSTENMEGVEQSIGWPVEDGPFHKLCWDNDSKLLAYSTGNKITVIDTSELRTRIFDPTVFNSHWSAYYRDEDAD